MPSPGAMATPSPGARVAPMPAPTFGPVSGTVRIMGVWGGTELDAFREVASQWEQQTGATVEFEGTRDLSAVLRARVEGGNPPDIAILPNPALMASFADRLQPLDQIVEMDRLENDYSEAWTELGTVNGNLYGLFIKAVPKNTVWYNPAQFEQNNFEIPQTWDELIQLSDQMAGTGTAPWSMGMESQAASGWPGSDWLQEIYLRLHGPDMYDQWVNHDIPWTDPSVREAFESFGEIVAGENYIAGGVQNALATNFQDAAYLPYMDPPRAYMYFLGAFAQTFINDQFPDLEAGEGYDFFPFPTINSQYEGALTGAADVAVAFNDSEATRSFMQFMATADAWEPWVELGGFISPNRSFDASLYPDPVVQRAAEQLTEAEVFRFDADDLMPAPVQQAEFNAVLEYMRSPNNLDSILQQVESVAADAYQQTR